MLKIKGRASIKSYQHAKTRKAKGKQVPLPCDRPLSASPLPSRLRNQSPKAFQADQELQYIR
eukprot:m.111923 g.111923  ORF g.111923 m.111923 type:complete len:62 (-) comp15401_c0_seq10:1743-1928(-)